MAEFKLQEGATAIEPVEIETGGWVPTVVDAKLTRNGIDWYRVKDGMGGRGDREDWIADVPEVCISVHDYHWNGSSFSFNYGTFENALDQSVARILPHIAEKIAEAQKRLIDLGIALGKLTLADVVSKVEVTNGQN